MKKILLTSVMAILSVFSLNAANLNIANLITSSDWNTIFPNRAQAGHVQGATDDFYSYDRFTSAVDKISEYSVTFSSGPDNQGTSVAVTKAGGSSWTYIITSSSWAGADYTVDYSTFCNTGNDYNDKRELSAFLANITKETTGGWVDPDPSKGASEQPNGSHGSWGLHWLRELGPGGNASAKSSNCYTTGSTIDYQPAAGKCYYGRGPIQISYFYNYGNFSEFLYDDKSLVSNPDLLEQDGELALLSAIWFWMTPQCPKPSCHQVMQEIYDESATSYSSAKMSKKGFLHTVNIINGDVECRGANAKPLLRSKLYKYYMSLIGFTSTEISSEDMGEYSTLCNSGGTMVKYTSCDFQNVVVNNCSTPALGADKELSGGTASLDASVTLKTDETIAWFKDGNIISGATSTTYTVTSTGTYNVVVTGEDCTKEDQIIVSAEVFICSEPALGKDKELVSGTTTLDANITLASGETIAWYKDDVLISGATSTTHTANEAGAYEAVTTRPGCNGEDVIIIYNEGEGPTCSKPELSDTVELTGSSVVLNSNITTLQDGETIAWYKDGSATPILNASGTTYTATSTGTYKVVLTGLDCTEEDEVVVAVICSKPNLGGDKGFGDGSVLLDANITLKPGETISWYKDGGNLWNSATTYTATALGIYKVVVISGPNWDPACTVEDEVEVAETTCSTPGLGEDISLCQGTSVTLDANVVLELGESLKWYKDDVEISGITTNTYTADAVGTYKAEVTIDNCVRSDEIVVADGGSQLLDVSASNNGEFCSTSAITEVTLTVTGGEGEYVFYDVPTEGEPLATGASFVVGGDLVEDGESKTFYVQEPSGPPVTLGGSESVNGSAWANQSTNGSWNNYRIVVNTLEKVTLESVDIVFWQNHVSHTIVVTVYELGTNNAVLTKTVELNGDDLSYVSGSTHPLNKVQLDLEFPEGNYEISFIGSSFTFNVAQSGVDFSDPKFTSEGVVEIKGVTLPTGWGYPEVNGTHLGVYNWVFKSGSAGACGRASVEVSADCGTTTDTKELLTDVIAVYPNPATDVLNINLGNINAENSSIELYSSVGQLVMSHNIGLESGNVIQFETSDIDGGLYFVKVLSEGKNYTTGVVITK
ncbi:MAG: glycoside hydrolase family 19 protein [Flavobacteriales bacterium]|nr:glycoside hydrolase family 19 protein [Flavobacteriales bacterium]